MKTRAVILAGGEGSRLGVLTAKRTKPAVPFAGKYRIIDFTLSNCVNSGLFDVMILAQYRPHSLIEHIGSGVPWDLDRNFTGGVSVHMPYKARGSSDWYLGTADAVQQNFLFIKRGPPDLVLILSGDHIYRMNYKAMIDYHLSHQAELTIAANRVPIEDAHRFGILGVEDDLRIKSFVEKPKQPESNLVNMGVYLFNADLLNQALWEDHMRADSQHDFGKDILPSLVKQGKRVFAYPFEGYWVDVGTIDSYWKAHMDLLASPPPIDLNDRSWIVHTRTEERPPVWVERGATVLDSMITDGCEIAADARVERSVLGPGVRVRPGAVVFESVILTDATIEAGAVVEHAIVDKKVHIGEKAHVGAVRPEPQITMIGKSSRIGPGVVIEQGVIIGPDVIESDFSGTTVPTGTYLPTKRAPFDI
jgi:glucose-1-phosphate adenylyltransferase